MTPAISSAAALIAPTGSAPRVTAAGATFLDILNDTVPSADAIDAAMETAPQGVPATDMRAVDTGASFSGLALPTSSVANPALASADKSEAQSEEPLKDSNARVMQVAQVSPELSVPHVIAAVAKAIAPQTETTKQTDDSTPQPTGRTIAALTIGRAEQRQRLSALSQKAAIDVPLVPKNETWAALVAADVPTPDSAPHVAAVQVPASISTFQPSPSVTVSTPDIRQIYLTPDNQWIDTLRNEIVSSAARDNQLQFTLKPEHLGKLDIILTTLDGKVDIRFDASTAAAAQILATKQVQLIEDLRQAGVKVGQFEMTNSQDGARQHQRQQQDTQPSDPQPTPKPNTLSNKMRGRFA